MAQARDAPDLCEPLRRSGIDPDVQRRKPMGLADQAKDLLGDNADKVKDVIDDAAEAIKDKTPDQVDGLVDQAAEKAKDVVDGQ
jgi:hypothetical protein